MPGTDQNRSNHARFDPAFHFFLAPLALLTFAAAVTALVRHPGLTTAVLLAAVVVAMGTLLLTRNYALRVQDRVIRLEERLRLSSLLPETLRLRVADITTAQLIALRFASDAELPELVRRVLTENWTGKQIKDAIQHWRGDYLRV